MTTALTVLFLYASETVSAFRLFFCFCASLPVQILLTENLKGEAWLSFLASALLGFILCPDRISWFFFVALLGHYGMLRSFFYRYINTVWVRGLFLVLYCNAGCALALWALYTITGVSYTDFSLPLPEVLCVILIEAAFFLLEGLYEACLRMYLKKLRPLLFRQR